MTFCRPPIRCLASHANDRFGLGTALQATQPPWLLLTVKPPKPRESGDVRGSKGRTPPDSGRAGHRGGTATSSHGTNPLVREEASLEVVAFSVALVTRGGIGDEKCDGVPNLRVRSRLTPPEREFFRTRTPSEVLQLIELSSFQHPYQNGRGSVASEKVGQERPKTA